MQLSIRCSYFVLRYRYMVPSRSAQIKNDSSPQMRVGWWGVTTILVLAVVKSGRSNGARDWVRGCALSGVSASRAMVEGDEARPKANG